MQLLEILDSTEEQTIYRHPSEQIFLKKGTVQYDT